MTLRKAVSPHGGSSPLVIQDADLSARQFPPTMKDTHGTFHKPACW
ncbi:hypothetical protein [Aquisphaera insulae]|nr:hypothetical protein [Aquisphaera insulae]